MILRANRYITEHALVVGNAYILFGGYPERLGWTRPSV